MPIKHRFVAMVVFAIIPLCSLQAAPLAPFYQVDTLIFSHITPDALSSESWAAENQASIKSDALTDNFFPSAPKKSYTLTREMHRIDQQSNYRLLAHDSWIIPVAALKKTITLPIDGGNYYDQSGQILFPQDVNNLQETPNSRELNGTLKISLDRYFNTTLNLFLNEPTDRLNTLDVTHQFSDWHNPLFTFKLHQQRRMPSRELNYIGHPLLGVLIKITPRIKLTEADYENLKNLETDTQNTH